MRHATRESDEFIVVKDRHGERHVLSASHVASLVEEFAELEVFTPKC